MIKKIKTTLPQKKFLIFFFFKQIWQVKQTDPPSLCWLIFEAVNFLEQVSFEQMMGMSVQTKAIESTRVMSYWTAGAFSAIYCAVKKSPPPFLIYFFFHFCNTFQIIKLIILDKDNLVKYNDDSIY